MTSGYGSRPHTPQTHPRTPQSSQPHSLYNMDQMSETLQMISGGGMSGTRENPSFSGGELIALVPPTPHPHSLTRSTPPLTHSLHIHTHTHLLTRSTSTHTLIAANPFNTNPFGSDSEDDEDTPPPSGYHVVNPVMSHDSHESQFKNKPPPLRSNPQGMD